MKVHAINDGVYCNRNHLQRNGLSYSHVSSKGISSTLVLLAAKAGSDAIKSKKKVQYLADLRDHVNSHELEKFITGVRASTKTPNAFYDYHHQGWALWTSSWMGEDLEYVDVLRERCLRSIDRIPDNNYMNVQTKKDLIRSLFENGHEISKDLIAKFAGLKDSIYKSFKKETVDTAFFSARYNQMRINDIWDEGFRYEHTTLPTEYIWRCEPFSFDYVMRGAANHDDNKKEICALTVAFDNLKLASILNKSLYSGYLADKRSSIEQFKRLLENYFSRVKQYGYQPPPETYREYINVLKPI